VVTVWLRSVGGETGWEIVCDGWGGVKWEFLMKESWLYCLLY
jgi:hypothetical protein